MSRKEKESKFDTIPKKIHYCWFGGKPLPESVKKCIESWKKHCPSYEIIQWNESNYDISKSQFMLSAYKAKKWGFVSDYARFDLIYEHGGLYLDTDVEIIKNWDPLLESDGFMGFEGNEYIASGLGFGAKPRNKIMKEMLDIYENLDFKKYENNLNKITSPVLVTSYLEKLGLKKDGELQKVGNLNLYPQDYFSPKSPLTRILNITKNTYSIHHYDASWVDKKEREFINSLEEKAKGMMESQSKLVSIIIPVYNGEKYLSEAIESALAQTYKNIEIIVIDDGSTDRTEEIGRGYGSRIKYIKKENGGVSSALNLGIEKMRGTYFSWLSHDDKYEPEKIEKQVALAESLDENTIVISNWSIIDTENNFIENKNLDYRLETLPTCFLAFDRKSWLNGCAMLIPKSIFDRYGNFNENLKSTQDYDLWFRISRKVKFKILKDYLFLSRAHSEQGSLTMQSALEASDSLHSEIINSLSTREISKYFEQDFTEIWEVYNSFFHNGYKKTPTQIIIFVIERFLKEKNYEVIEKALRERLVGEIKDEKLVEKVTTDVIAKMCKKKRKKRLFFCSAHWYTGGVERVLSNLFPELLDNYEIILITPHTEQKGCISIPKEVIHIEVSNDLFCNHYDFVIYAYASLLDVDVVIGCMNLFSKILNFYKLAEGSKFKTIASSHEYYFYPYHNPYFYDVVKQREEAFKFVDAVTCLTSFNTAVCNIYNNNKGYLIPNPNTFKVQKNIINKKREKIVLSVGRFNDPIKRIDRILKCFKEIINDVPDAKLILVGKCDISLPFSEKGGQTIRDLFEELDLPKENVRFLGEIEEISKYYLDASVLLLTSENEGFPMVVNEAACFGVPSVCNYIPGIEDIIEDGVSGYILEQDDLKGMAKKVSEILQNNSLRVKIGKAAKVLVEKYSKEKVSEKWIFLIETLISETSDIEKQELLQKKIGFGTIGEREFVNSLGMELNNIFYDNINRNKPISQSSDSLIFEVRRSNKLRERVIDKIIKGILSIREKGLKSTVKHLFMHYIRKLLQIFKTSLSS